MCVSLFKGYGADVLRLPVERFEPIFVTYMTYENGQSRPFWAVLKLLLNSNMKSK